MLLVNLRGVSECEQLLLSTRMQLPQSWVPSVPHSCLCSGRMLHELQIAEAQVLVLSVLQMRATVTAWHCKSKRLASMCMVGFSKTSMLLLMLWRLSVIGCEQIHKQQPSSELSLTCCELRMRSMCGVLLRRTS